MTAANHMTTSTTDANTVPTIERHDLLGPLRSMTGSETAEPVSWGVEKMSGGFGNPVSLGLYRVSGDGRDREQAFRWSLVLKVAQSPSNVGLGDLGGGEDATHWNYWRREHNLYPSDLLSRLPAGLAAPRCFGVADRPGDHYWVWLEEIADDYQGVWPVARYGTAARHLGRLAGAYAGSWQPSGYPWLARATLRQFAGGMRRIAPWSADPASTAQALEHPVFRRLFTEVGRARFAAWVLGIDRLLDALDTLPRTLGHQDAYPTNLMSRRDDTGREVTVLLDWGMAGIAPIGGDLAQLFIGLFQNNAHLTPEETERLVAEPYLQGLREASWIGEDGPALLGFRATSLFRLTFLMLFFLGGPTTGAADTLNSEAHDKLVNDLSRIAQLWNHLAPQMEPLLNGAHRLP